MYCLSTKNNTKHTIIDSKLINIYLTFKIAAQFFVNK